MKSLLFALWLVSFVVYRAEKVEVRLDGTWKGSYKTAEKMSDVKIVFGQDDNIVMYTSEIKGIGKALGSYTVKKNNEIVIVCKWPGANQISFTMNGRLSPKKNSVTGDWELDNHSFGSFYLTKAIL